MKWFFFLALLLVATPAAGQVAVDTVWVTVEGPLFETTITTVTRRMQLGDTVQFVAIAQDQQGDSVTAAFTWATSDPGLVSIDPLTGIAIALGKTRQGVAISVLTEQVTELVLASFRDGELNWSGRDTVRPYWEPSLGDTAWWAGNETTPGRFLPDTLLVFPILQYCAYLINATRQLVAQDPGPPLCPLVFQDIPLQTNTLFASVPRIRPLLQVRGSPG